MNHIFTKKTLHDAYPPLFKKAIVLSILSGLCLILISTIMGKQAFFLLLNHDLGLTADYIFTYLTYLGDGILWIPMALYFILVNKKKIPLLLSTIMISTLLVQLGKQIITPGTLRPIAAILDKHSIHTVKNVIVHTINSFPSGHTTTVFSFFLLGCLYFNQLAFLYIGFVLAILTGYSRIYLAQHFPLDVGAGMITAVISVYCAYMIQARLEKQYFTKE